MFGVEVAMCEVIAHPGDVHAGDVWLAIEERWRDRSDRLADFDQADTDGIEDEAIVETAPTEVIVDGGDRSQDVPESLVVSSAHSGIASARTWSRRAGLSELTGTTSTSVPRSAAISRVSPARPTTPTSARRSTRRSTSL